MFVWRWFDKIFTTSMNANTPPGTCKRKRKKRIKKVAAVSHADEISNQACHDEQLETSIFVFVFGWSSSSFRLSSSLATVLIPFKNEGNYRRTKVKHLSFFSSSPLIQHPEGILRLNESPLLFGTCVIQNND